MREVGAEGRLRRRARGAGPPEPRAQRPLRRCRRRGSAPSRRAMSLGHR
ncbi:hypothetical protein ACP4OV_016594 [Aristida adscensionis]